ncbi:cytochrome P450 monooxygenase-like protein [Byssothecium circinans]|uniref:Cytochrome P450 monooxygenase-like protein n=1 Tax=Byssothecium circinans TaxID=147558 RepID=A0A6A5U6X7_9PLEO|nr:cytochrome P450 monooxygenase-like protein [Byssothecium circinans]
MALLTVLITLAAFPAALLVWTAQSLARNRAKAKAIGLPYLVRWISPINPFWLLWGSSFVRLCRRFGVATENLTRIYSYGWEANERAKIHVDFGDAFVVVHPGGIQLCVSSPEAIYDILQRRTDFRRNMEEFGVLNVYGKNLSTTDDQEWQRHRKMTAVTFTEKNNELVWQQSLSQAKGMLEHWTHSTEPIRSTHKDSKIFTLNVLAAALFNKAYPFNAQTDANTQQNIDDKSYQYRESLSTILSSIIQIFIFGEQGLQAWWLPKSWKDAGVAMSTFRSYILGLMNEERGYLSQGNTGRQHLVARLVRACEEEQAEKDGTAANGGKVMMLTEEEIISNLFVYAFAGNDTTAIALTNLIIHLAANPETQEWIAEEINFYLTNDASDSWTYDNFSKLKRCAAVVMETLRICHPLSQLVKTTNATSQPLKVDGTTYILPPETSIHCSLPALHTHPRYWGSDPMAWNPQHFIQKTKSEVTQATDDSTPPFANEKVAADTSEHCMPWAWGQRVCPGKRFSQVELVAVLAALFRDWRVEPVLEKGETMEQAQNRVWKASLVVDHEGHMLHEMVNPEAVGLRWIRRKVANGVKH